MRLNRANGKWFSEDGNEFKGHVMKDLEKGDVVEFVNGEGKKNKVTIINKEITVDGFIVIEHKLEEVM
jgi:hypothetical protein